MPLAPFQDLMSRAEKGAYAVGYFESWNFESLLAVADAAEATRSPVILGFSGIYLPHPQRVVHDPISTYAAMGIDVCKHLSVPACLLFNESPNLNWVHDAIDNDFGLVMYTDEHLDLAEQTKRVRDVVSRALPKGVSVEGEMTSLPGVGGQSLDPQAVDLHLTDPKSAAKFVEETGVDALAVNVGQIHLHGRRRAALDLSRLAAIRETVRVPLVLHGASSIAPEDLRESIALGIRKINVGSILKQRYFGAMRDRCGKVSDSDNPYEVIGSGLFNDVLVAGRVAMQRTVEELMSLFGSAGKAQPARTRMVSKIIIPSLGATGGDVVVEQWLVKVGDHIEAGAAIATVSTDKANVDLEAFRAGFVREIVVSDGTSVPVGATVALIADSMDEPLKVDAKPQPSVGQTFLSATRGGTPPRASSATEHVEDELDTRQAGMPAPLKKDHRVLASPLARRVAQSNGINLAQVTGSGRRGAIHHADVMKHLDAKPTASPCGTKLSSMRKAIAARTTQSKTEIPHFYLTARIDMTAATALREQGSQLAESRGTPKPSVTDLAIASAARALRRVPQLNVSYHDDGIVSHESVNLGVVVGLDEGMIIPVIRAADTLDLFDTATTTRRLKDRAVAGTLGAHELSGGTFTISNLGMFGIDNFIAVINPPEAAILALGAIRNELALSNGNVIERPILTVTLSADHRAVDGVTAAKFLGAFKEILEHPLELVAATKSKRDDKP